MERLVSDPAKAKQTLKPVFRPAGEVIDLIRKGFSPTSPEVMRMLELMGHDGSEYEWVSQESEENI